jgi:calcineurin-like phosphoesterase family protein
MYVFTADFHLGDDRFELMGRPFTSAKEMAEKLIYGCRQAVTSKFDKFFFVGDICYKPEFLHYLDQLPNCKRCLLRGNHDRQFDDATLSRYFDAIIPEEDGVEIIIDDLRCYVTHYPTQGRNHQFNLVGHIHSAWKVQLNMLNVGVDVHNYLPITGDKVRFYYNAIKNFYDEDVWVAYKDVNAEYRGVRGQKGRYLDKK